LEEISEEMQIFPNATKDKFPVAGIGPKGAAFLLTKHVSWSGEVKAAVWNCWTDWCQETISSDFCLRRRARRFYMTLSRMTVMEYLILKEESNEGLAEVSEFANLEMWKLCII
jgi:predicted NBD/HSP70 family sugar kinase